MRTLGRYRDVQELLPQRSLQVSHETLREWCIKFAPLFAEELRHQEPQLGLYECQWRSPLALVGRGRVQVRAGHSFLAASGHRSGEDLPDPAAGEYEVQEAIHTDQLRSHGAAIREIPSWPTSTTSK